MKPTNEKGLVGRIVAAITRRYPHAWIIKTHGGPRQVAGLPDLFVCVDGQFIGLEVKHQKPGESDAHARGRATRQQLEQIRRIEAAGGTAAVVLTVEEALETIYRAILH